MVAHRGSRSGMQWDGSTQQGGLQVAHRGTGGKRWQRDGEGGGGRMERVAAAGQRGQWQWDVEGGWDISMGGQTSRHGW